MSKSYFFLGLGVGLILSGSIFLFFSDKTEKTPETEFAQTEKKENLESEEFKKLLKEIEQLKDSEEDTKSSEESASKSENKKETEDIEVELTEKEEILNKEVKEKETVKNEVKIVEEAKIENTKLITEAEVNKASENKKETSTEEESVKKEETLKNTEKEEDIKKETDKKETVKKTTAKKAVKKGKITIIDNKEKDTETAEKFQIQFRSSKNLKDSERIKEILKDVIDTEIILIGEYYRVFSKESFSEEIANDVAVKIKKVYNLGTIVWFSDYNLIFKEDKNIKNCEDLQKKISKYIDTTIKFIDNTYVLMTKNPIPKNLGVEVADYINNDMVLDVIIKQS